MERVEKGRGARRLFVRRVSFIIDNRTGRIVGSQHEWNTGEKCLHWKGERVPDFSLQPCAAVTPWPQLDAPR